MPVFVLSEDILQQEEVVYIRSKHVGRLAILYIHHRQGFSHLVIFVLHSAKSWLQVLSVGIATQPERITVDARPTSILPLSLQKVVHGRLGGGRPEVRAHNSKHELLVVEPRFGITVTFSKIIARESREMYNIVTVLAGRLVANVFHCQGLQSNARCWLETWTATCRHSPQACRQLAGGFVISITGYRRRHDHPAVHDANRLYPNLTCIF